MSDADVEPLLTIKDVAERLNVTERWVRDKVSAQAIPYTRIGKHVRFTQAQVEAIIEHGVQNPRRASGRRGWPRL